MRKKQKRKIIVGTIFAILCGGLIAGLLIVPKQKQTNNPYSLVERGSGKLIQNPSLPKKGISINSEKDVSVSNGSDVLSQKSTTTNTIPFAKRATFKVAGEDFIIQVSDYVTVYDAMNGLMSEGQITFEGKDYPGLGFFVTQINSLESGGGKNLMYYVNNKEATLGVSTYVVKEGDIIEWKLK